MHQNSKKNISAFGIVIIFAVALGFLIFYNGFGRSRPFADTKFVQIDGVKIKVELALTEAEREQGLSGRDGLADDAGMLFVFDHPDKYLFWMKDMNFPIDMIWIGQDSKIIYIQKNASPDSYPQKTFGPETPATYVLEVPAGFSDKNGLKEGDQVKFF